MSTPRGFALAQTELRCFDRSFSAHCHVQKPDRYRLIEALPVDVQRITRGSGISYVGASFAADSVVQDVGAFDRLLEFNTEQGLLTVEAGARIGDVQRFALSHGWMLPVAPGHPQASIGGCIAADVHGKNPARDGTFRRQVESIELFDASHGWMVASADQSAERFAACFAGFGIPGLIGSATLRMVPAPSAYSLRNIAVANLIEAAEVLRTHVGAPLLYGWHDGRAENFGRGVIRFGLDAQENTQSGQRLAPDLPATIEPWPVCAWNRIGIGAMNHWISRRYRRTASERVSVEAAMFPLNEARRYFAGFGKQGFVEAQWLLPHATYADFVAALGAEVARSRPRISLIASKLFDGEAEGFAFDGKGLALAIQLPHPRSISQAGFIEAMTELALGHGGRPNLIKESSLQADAARRGIPGFGQARDRLRSFDPNNLQVSELSRRLSL